MFSLAALFLICPPTAGQSYNFDDWFLGANDPLTGLQSPEFLNDKGVFLMNIGRFDSALQCLDKAIEMDPKLGAAWNNKGIALGQTGKYEEAIDCFEQAAMLNTTDAWPLFNKGLALFNMGRLEDSL
jgi:tetratricopeptide (TPR) repeat protein